MDIIAVHARLFRVKSVNAIYGNSCKNTKNSFFQLAWADVRINKDFLMSGSNCESFSINHTKLLSNQCIS